MAKKGIRIQISEELLESLQLIATQKHSSLSKIAAEFLEAGFQLSGEKASELMLIPKLEEAIARTMNHSTNRIAALLSRTAINAGINRRMMKAFLGAQVGDDLAMKAEDRARREEVIELKNKHSELGIAARELAKELTSLETREAMS